jgi:hypothetical protein
MTDVAKRPMLVNPRYQVKGSFGIIRGLTVKTLWGLWRSDKKLDLPEIPESAVVTESWVSDSGLTRDRVMLSLAFLSSSKGKAFFRAYAEELKKFVTRYHVEVDDHFLKDALSWSLEIEVFDSTAPNGSREMFGFEMLGVHQLENTVNALKSYVGASSALTILNDDDDEEHYEQYERYLSLAHYMALDDKKVIMHFNDFDEESSETAFDVLHQVELERTPFASAMMLTYGQIKACIDEVSKALDVESSRLKSR